jgi:outer membrane lipoprotein SlyB
MKQLRKKRYLEDNRQDSLAAGILGGIIGYGVGGPAGAVLGFIFGAGLSEATKDKERNFRRIL